LVAFVAYLRLLLVGSDPPCSARYPVSSTVRVKARARKETREKKTGMGDTGSSTSASRLPPVPVLRAPPGSIYDQSSQFPVLVIERILLRAGVYWTSARVYQTRKQGEIFEKKNEKYFDGSEGGTKPPHSYEKFLKIKLIGENPYRGWVWWALGWITQSCSDRVDFSKKSF